MAHALLHVLKNPPSTLEKLVEAASLAVQKSGRSGYKLPANWSDKLAELILEHDPPGKEGLKKMMNELAFGLGEKKEWLMADLLTKVFKKRREDLIHRVACQEPDIYHRAIVDSAMWKQKRSISQLDDPGTIRVGMRILQTLSSKVDPGQEHTQEKDVVLLYHLLTSKDDILTKYSPGMVAKVANLVEDNSKSASVAKPKI